jgi:hypothetical protein
MVSARLRLVGASLLALTLAACATEPMAPGAANSAIALKNGVPDPAPSPATGIDYTGLWVETGTPIGYIGGGRSQQIWVEFEITRSGSGFSGTAHRYITYFLDGVVTTARIDLGTPGRVTATPTAAGLNVTIQKLAEQKLNLGYTTAVSADLRTLTVINPKVLGGTSFVKQ